jgi:predicted metalloprotease
VLPPPEAAPWQHPPATRPGEYAPYSAPPDQYGGAPGQYSGAPGQYSGAPGPYGQYGGQQPQYGQSPGRWVQPYPPNHFNGFQPQRRKSGILRVLLLTFMVLTFLGVSLVIGVVLLVGRAITSDQPGTASGPSVVPTPTVQSEKGSADDVLLNSPVYQAGGLGRLDCPAAPLGNGDLAAQKVYYEKLFTCLNDAWRPVFTKLGTTGPDPGLVVFDRPVNTPCGAFQPLSGRVLAFYCYGNQVMYADVRQMNKAFGARQDLAYLLTIAHEYGHHIQGVTGLFAARAVYLQDHPGEKLESSRRNEVQASCFAGVFSKAVAQSYPFTRRLDEFEYQASNSFGEAADTPANERTHGQAATQGFWIMNGFNVGDTKACNTFAAPANLVR